MAHFKRRRLTSKKEDKRLDSKKVRASESQALHGGHFRQPHVDPWGRRAPIPPMLDETSTRYPKSKGKRKKLADNTCPSNPRGTRHHYLIEKRVEVREYTSPWSDRTSRYRVEYLYHLCGWCGKEKRTKIKTRWRR
jgi:hypothetical protein